MKHVIPSLSIVTSCTPPTNTTFMVIHYIKVKMKIVIYCNNYAVTELDQKVHHLIMGGYRLSTSKVYKSIQEGFILYLLPTQSITITTDRTINIKIHSIHGTKCSRSFNVYLAAIRALHISNYLPPPLVTP